jgi:putative resolvase
VKLAEWARSFGVHPQTAYRWFREDRMPVPARRLPSGTIVVDPPEVDRSGRTVAYVRVSSHEQRPDLEAQAQAARVRTWCAGQGVGVDEVVSEVGSGVNGPRPGLARLLCDPEVAAIVVERRDRLARFGVEHLEAALAATGRRIMVVEPSQTTGDTEDLLRDMIEVLTCMCAGLYGRRGARNRAMRAVTATKQNPATKQDPVGEVPVPG